MPNRHVIALAAAALTAASTTAMAHHSQAMWNTDLCDTLVGTVRTFQYQFPHSWLWVDAVGADGKATIWAFEAAAPAQMIEIDKRWSHELLKVGDKITIHYSPHKIEGRTAGALHSLVLPNGSKIIAATAACQREPDAVTRPPSTSSTP